MPAAMAASASSARTEYSAASARTENSAASARTEYSAASVPGAAPAPLVAFLLNQERRHELEWAWLASTPGMMQVLSACTGLREERRWRAEVLRLDNEWWWHGECLAEEEEAIRREVWGYLRSPSSCSS